MNRKIASVIILLIGGFANQAIAQTQPLGPAVPPQVNAETADVREVPFSIDLSLAVVSDYRFRGISLSDKAPALQPSVTLTHKSGLYASVWGSNIADDGGDNRELDLVAGYSGQSGSLSYGVNVTNYLYRGASNLNYVEFIGNVGTTVGSVTIGVTVGYVPKQRNLADQDNLYVATTGSLPIKGTPLSLAASFGIENGAFASAKRDWSVGVAADVAGFTLGVSYVDTARSGASPQGQPAAVFTISRVF